MAVGSRLNLFVFDVMRDAVECIGVGSGDVGWGGIGWDGVVCGGMGYALWVLD